jgi:hypothetical protein
MRIAVSCGIAVPTKPRNWQCSCTCLRNLESPEFQVLALQKAEHRTTQYLKKKCIYDKLALKKAEPRTTRSLKTRGLTWSGSTNLNIYRVRFPLFAVLHKSRNLKIEMSVELTPLINSRIQSLYLSLAQWREATKLFNHSNVNYSLMLNTT